MIKENNAEWGKIFDAIDDWICIIALDATILRTNQSVEKYFQSKKRNPVGLKCCQILHGIDRPPRGCPLNRMLKTKVREGIKEKDREGGWIWTSIDPLFNRGGDLVGAVHMSRDIDQRLWTQSNKEKFADDNNTTTGQIKILRGLLPICSSCKKIRDSNGSWICIESYIHENSEAHFSHGMCPDCSEKFYGNDDWYIDMKKGTPE